MNDVQNQLYGSHADVDLNIECQRMLLRLHENHENVKFRLDDPSLKVTDPFRFHSYYLVTRPKTYPQQVTKRVSPLMPVQVKSMNAHRWQNPVQVNGANNVPTVITQTIEGKQVKLVKLPQDMNQLVVNQNNNNSNNVKKPLRFTSGQSIQRAYKTLQPVQNGFNPNSNNSNNRLSESPELDSDISPVFDKMGNRIGIRRATSSIAASMQMSKRPKMDLSWTSDSIIEKPIEVISTGSADAPPPPSPPNLNTTRDSNGNEVVEIQPESPKSNHSDEIEEITPEESEIIPQADNDQIMEINANEFYMPTASASLTPYTPSSASIMQYNVSGRGRAIKNQNNPKAKHQCEVCLKRFVRPAELLRHVRIHTGEKPFECETCKQCFIRKDHLISHQRTHSTEVFSCTLCTFKTTRNDSLKRHLKKHTDVYTDLIQRLESQDSPLSGISLANQLSQLTQKEEFRTSSPTENSFISGNTLVIRE